MTEYADPTLGDIDKRLRILERKKLTLKDLPIKTLREAVLLNEPQDPVQMMLPKSVTEDLISDDVFSAFVKFSFIQDIEIDVGVVTMEWGGASSGSNLVTVTHRLEKEPLFLFATCNTSSNTNVSTVGEKTDSIFKLQGNQVDGSIPAAGQTKPASWLVFG